MARLLINERFRTALARLGLVAPQDFLRLSGVIYSGHPDRHVAEVTLRGDPEPLVAFLKKEHRVPWRDRLFSAWQGFGPVSKSCREFHLLESLRRAGIGCPEPLAAGEDDRGRAFLLLAAIQRGQELRSFLRDQAGRPELRRQALGRLGAALGALHEAGFDHPDLFAKHILVAGEARQAQFYFLDWQRSRRRRRLSWLLRCRDLAALNASVAEELAGRRDRLSCLRAYLRHGSPSVSPRRILRIIQARTAALLRKRRIQEMRLPPLPAGTQNLIWLDGEALCLTREFCEATGGQVPSYLRCPPRDLTAGQVRRMRVPIPGPGAGSLVRRSARRPLRWLWSWLRGKALPSPELEQAGTYFRLERVGVSVPTILAVGQRRLRPWHTESFLLTRQADGPGLLAWLAARTGGPLGTATLCLRRRVMRQAGELLRRLHEAGCHLGPCSAEDLAGLFVVQQTAESTNVLLAGPVARGKGRLAEGRVLADLRRLVGAFGTVASRTDVLRFLLAYQQGNAALGQAPRLVRAALRYSFATRSSSFPTLAEARP
jgi:tRNA A-37 threonylcarbamoyl transferase component Bud32